MRVTLTTAAASDVEQIGDYIALDNPARALTYIDELQRRIAKLGELPQAGRSRPEWADGVRSTPFGSYLIVWWIRGDLIEILRVVHGARDLDALFSIQPLD